MDFQKELLAEYDREVARTRKTLEAIPAGADLGYKPHEKSMSLGRLAGHLTDMTGRWALDTLRKDKLEFGADHKWEPYVPDNREEVLKKLDADLAEVRHAIGATTPEQWDRHWKFVYAGTTFIDEPRYQVFRDYVLNHMIHHRAQLSVYLRLLGAKVPGSYGPSADEM